MACKVFCSFFSYVIVAWAAMKDGEYFWMPQNDLEYFTDDILIFEDSTEELDDPCMTIRYDSDSGKFIATEQDCNDDARGICSHVPPSLACTDTAENDNSGKPEVDKLVNTDKEAVIARNKAMADLARGYKAMFRQINMTAAFDNIFGLLWYSTLPCYNIPGLSQYAMIKKCAWKGKTMNCSAIFETFPTDRGMCCTFNMDAAEKIFSESRFQESVIKYQHLNKLEATPPPEWYTSNNEPTSQAGINKGFSLVLDAHTALLAPGSVSEDFQGFFAVVDEPTAYPQANQKNIRIRPGYDNLVSLSATTVTANSDIKSVDPNERYCYFSDEHPLKLTNQYSQASCMLECRMDYVREYLREDFNITCVPW